MIRATSSVGIVMFCFAIFSSTSSLAAAQNYFELIRPSGSQNYVLGCEYTADIKIKTASFSNAADIIVQYNPDKIEVVDGMPEIPGTQILTGTAYQSYIGNKVDTQAGIIRLTGVSIEKVFSGEGIFGRIKFKGKSTDEKTSFAIKYDGEGKSNDSNIAEVNTSSDLLGGANSIDFNFVNGNCAQDTAEPSVEFVEPRQGQNEVPSNIPVQLKISENLSGVDVNSIEVIINGFVFTAASPEVSMQGDASGYLVTIKHYEKIFKESPSTVLVRVKDLAGNQKESSIAFNFKKLEGQMPIGEDSSAPKIQFIKPVNRETITQSETIDFEISDSGSGVDINSLQIILNEARYRYTDNQLSVTQRSGTFRISINGFVPFKDSDYSSMTVFVADKAKNYALEQIRFNIPTKEPSSNGFLSPENSPRFLLFCVTPFMVLVLSIVAFFIWKSKKPKKSDNTTHASAP